VDTGDGPVLPPVVLPLEAVPPVDDAPMAAPPVEEPAGVPLDEDEILAPVETLVEIAPAVADVVPMDSVEAQAEKQTQSAAAQEKTTQVNDQPSKRGIGLGTIGPFTLAGC
jgi:hypothetical protein